jgi:mannose-1-phosphate guanylyltransferase
MKAFLLAAGLGSRLRPYTDTIPKCLIPIHGKPLLKIWLELLDRYHVEEVLINIHHQAKKANQFIADIKEDVRVKITTFYEQRLLGSAGTIAVNREFVAGSENFIIAYADNLTSINLSHMIEFHHQVKMKGGLLTMGLFHPPDPRDCGIAVMNEENKIVRFVEKPKNPMGGMANGGIYIASSEIFDFIPAQGDLVSQSPTDMGLHVLPALIGKMYGYEIKEYLRDIGTIESYHKALKEWPQ